MWVLLNYEKQTLFLMEIEVPFFSFGLEITAVIISSVLCKQFKL